MPGSGSIMIMSGSLPRLVGLALLLAACGPSESFGPGLPIDGSAALLSASARRMRAGQIRDAAATRGIRSGYLLAGIADAETNMCHCWSELTWACQGPLSPDCGGGPVVAGKYDGDCAAEQGGLGMFQFDAGDYA